MSTVAVTDQAVEIRLSLAEKVAALHGDLRLPRRSIRTATVVADGLAATRGLKAPGLSLPGRVRIGTWRGRGGNRFLAVRRGVPALRLELVGERFGLVVVSTPDAAVLAGELTAGLPAL